MLKQILWDKPKVEVFIDLAGRDLTSGSIINVSASEIAKLDKHFIFKIKNGDVIHTYTEYHIDNEDGLKIIIDLLDFENSHYVITGNTLTYDSGDGYFMDTDKTLSIENLPADAKATGDAIKAVEDEVDDVKSDLSHMETGDPSSSDAWEQGTCYANGSNVMIKSSSTSRCRITANVIKSNVALIKAKTGYQVGAFAVNYVDGNYMCVYNFGTWGNEVDVSAYSADYPIWVNARKTDDATISTTEAQNNVEFYDRLSVRISDIKTNADEVPELVTNQSVLLNAGHLNIDMGLEGGGINASTGANYSGGTSYNNRHKRSATYLDLVVGTTYIFKTFNGDLFNLFKYNTSDSYTGSVGWGSFYIYTATASEKIRIVYANDNQDISISHLLNSVVASPQNAVIDAIVYPTPSYDVPSALSASSVYTETSTEQGACQGMCTDGTYLYVARQTALTDSAPTELIKIAISDFTVSARVEGNWGHCNDLVYDSTNNYICAIYTFPTAYSTLLRFDASTLAYVDSIDLSAVAHGINANAEFAGVTYLSDYNRYVFAVIVSNICIGFAFTDDSFNLENFVKILPTGKTFQNIDAYDGMIVLTDFKNGTDGTMKYYDFHGNLISTVNAKYLYELEAVAIVNGTYYLSYNATGYKTVTIYRAVASTTTKVMKADVLSQYNPNC